MTNRTRESYGKNAFGKRSTIPRRIWWLETSPSGCECNIALHEKAGRSQVGPVAQYADRCFLADHTLYNSIVSIGVFFGVLEAFP